MVDSNLIASILDSLKSPVLFTDLDHIVRYMNAAAIAHYEGGEELIGTSLLDCHNENSNKIIVEILESMQTGEEIERLISEEDEHLIFMRAVRDSEGKVVGYYERYEPVAK